MPFDLSKIIVRIFPLPPPEKRRSGLIPATWFHNALRLDRATDYICCQIINLMVIAGATLVAAILVDAHFAASLLIDSDEFRQNKLLLPITFSRLIGLPALALTILFYLRIRLTLDLCRDDIPVLAHPALLLTTSRRRWIGRSLIGMVVGLLCIFLSHIVPVRVTLHFEMQDSLAFILLVQVFSVAAVAVGPLALISYGLVAEKAMRCFPSFEANLKRIADDIPVKNTKSK